MLSKRRCPNPVGEIEKRPDGFWIWALPAGWPDHGAYKTKAEAEEDQRGLTFQYRDNRSYWDAQSKTA